LHEKDEYPKLREPRGDLGYWEVIRKSKDPPSFMVLFEDCAALLGIIIVALGIFLSQTLALPVLNGVASVMIGLVLACVATILPNESKSLLSGEQASPVLVSAVIALALGEHGIVSANGALTVHLSPDQVLVAFVEISEELRSLEIEHRVESIETRIRSAHPEIVALFIKPQTRLRFEQWKTMRYGRSEI
jgi:divalent metal cation (Fe/Co/Zn/Cd) transporter